MSRCHQKMGTTTSAIRLFFLSFAFSDSRKNKTPYSGPASRSPGASARASPSCVRPRRARARRPRGSPRRPRRRRRCRRPAAGGRRRRRRPSPQRQRAPRPPPLRRQRQPLRVPGVPFQGRSHRGRVRRSLPPRQGAWRPGHRRACQRGGVSNRNPFVEICFFFSIRWLVVFFEK